MRDQLARFLTNHKAHHLAEHTTYTIQYIHHTIKSSFQKATGTELGNICLDKMATIDITDIDIAHIGRFLLFLQSISAFLTFGKYR